MAVHLCNHGDLLSWNWQHVCDNSFHRFCPSCPPSSRSKTKPNTWPCHDKPKEEETNQTKTKKRTWDRPREDKRRQDKTGIKTGKIAECKAGWIERWYIRSWGCVGCIGCVCCILHTSCVRFSRGLHAGLRYHIWAFFRYTNLSGFPGEIWVHMYSGIWVYMWGW